MEEKDIPLDGENPEIMESTESWSPEPVWGKVGEWSMYKQQPQDAEWDDGKAEKKQEFTDDFVRGCLVFYVDVGQLPPFKAEAFVERMKRQLNDGGGLTRIKRDHEVFFVPVRSGVGTRVKYIPFN